MLLLQILIISLAINIVIGQLLSRSDKFLFNFIQWHHLYTGITMMVFGTYFIIQAFILSSIFLLVIGILTFSIGFYLSVDDIGQHRLQVVLKNPSYISFGHYFGKPLYHIRRWLIQVTGWQWLGKI